MVGDICGSRLCLLTGTTDVTQPRSPIRLNRVALPELLGADLPARQGFSALLARVLLGNLSRNAEGSKAWKQ